LYTDPDDPKYRQYGGLILRKIHDVHEVYACNRDGNLYIIHAFAENEFYPMVKEEIARIVLSWNFDAQPTPETPAE